MNNNPYVFISYAHLDSGVVLPCVEAMKRSGINLWFDEGIEAGSEWPEFIAEKVVGCSKFVLFISKAYLNSQNCKRELNFAISRKKDILSIFIEDVDLSPGMEMQLGTYQAIYRKRFDGTEAFHNSLSAESFFNICRSSQWTPPAARPEPAVQPEPTVQKPAAEPINLGNTFGEFFGGAQSAPQPNYQPYPASQSAMGFDPRPVKSKTLAGLLAIFLGTFGVHNFYLKQTVFGILHLIFFWTPYSAIVGVIEGIVILLSSDEKFEKRYKCRKK